MEESLESSAGCQALALCCGHKCVHSQLSVLCRLLCAPPHGRRTAGLAACKAVVGFFPIWDAEVLALLSLCCGLDPRLAVFGGSWAVVGSDCLSDPFRGTRSGCGAASADSPCGFHALSCACAGSQPLLTAVQTETASPLNESCDGVGNIAAVLLGSSVASLGSLSACGRLR